MVAQNTVRTYGKNEVFQFLEGIHVYIEKVVKSECFFLGRNVFLHTCVIFSELPSYISTMAYNELISNKYICIYLSGMLVKSAIRVKNLFLII